MLDAEKLNTLEACKKGVDLLNEEKDYSKLPCLTSLLCTNVLPFGLAQYAKISKPSFG